MDIQLIHVAGGVLAIGFIWLLFSTRRHRRSPMVILGKTPRVPIAEFPNLTTGKIVGHLHYADKTLTAPLSGRKCAGFHLIADRVVGGRSLAPATPATKRVVDGQVTAEPLPVGSWCDFFLEDDTGTAIARITGADCHIAPDAVLRRGGDTKAKLEAFRQKFPESTFADPDPDLTYREAILTEGQEVWVLGHGKTDGSALDQVLSSWKNTSFGAATCAKAPRLVIGESAGAPFFLCDKPTLEEHAKQGGPLRQFLGLLAALAVVVGAQYLLCRPERSTLQTVRLPGLRVSLPDWTVETQATEFWEDEYLLKRQDRAIAIGWQRQARTDSSALHDEILQTALHAGYSAPYRAEPEPLAVSGHTGETLHLVSPQNIPVTWSYWYCPDDGRVIYIVVSSRKEKHLYRRILQSVVCHSPGERPPPPPGPTAEECAALLRHIYLLAKPGFADLPASEQEKQLQAERPTFTEGCLLLPVARYRCLLGSKSETDLGNCPP